MNCRRCKRNGKDVEMVKSRDYEEWTRWSSGSGGEMKAGKFYDCLKCPECGWSVSV